MRNYIRAETISQLIDWLIDRQLNGDYFDSIHYFTRKMPKKKSGFAAFLCHI